MNEENTMATLNILKDCGDSYKYQGPRFIVLGSNSGEDFRDNYLIPWLNSNQKDKELIIDFEGTIVYTPSFLEESFGGAIRKGYDIVKTLTFIHLPDTQLHKIQQYIGNAKPK